MKKTISIILALTILFSAFYAFGVSAQAVTATNYTLGTKVNGSISSSNKEKNYKFVIPSSGRITVAFESTIESQELLIYNSNFDEYAVNDKCIFWNDSLKQAKENWTTDLIGGTYYFSVQQINGDTGNYNFKITFNSANESFSETNSVYGNNNDYKSAKKIEPFTTYKGQIAKNDEIDNYYIELGSTKNIRITYISEIDEQHFYIYDSNNDVVCQEYIYLNSDLQQAKKAFNVKLNKGKFYFTVKKYWLGGTGNYSFRYDYVVPVNTPAKLKCTARGTYAEKLSWNKVSGASGYQVAVSNASGNKWAKTYNATSNSLTIKNLVAGGKYKFMVRAYVKAYGKVFYSKWSSALTSPTKPVIIKLKGVSSPGKTLIKTNWAKASGLCTGYQIVYGKNKACTKLAAKKNVPGQSKTSYTGKNFTKGHIYYVKVRAYTAVGGKYYYGPWSATKAVKSK